MYKHADDYKLNYEDNPRNYRANPLKPEKIPEIKEIIQLIKPLLCLNILIH